MKKSLSIIGITLLVVLMSFVNSTNYELKQSTADVEQYQGVYIFIHSKPASTYEYIATEKTEVVWSAKASEAINAMVKTVKKKYPNANGIIFTDENLWKADAILIK